ncbi:hypothetical protein L210DRAFT_990279 [Boletus edulis BED1]|uniref:Uncharacterized protein n=1 Tax=Boletus edulis BED1 TaxID=1328754 RepID=A0AAD4GA08_BOLED|nr:hypothetical protein L210DRAFT_990279 [Boletus edulis BED1]
MSSPPPLLGPSILRHLQTSLPTSFHYPRSWSTISGLRTTNLNPSGSPLEFNKEKYGL